MPFILEEEEKKDAQIFYEAIPCIFKEEASFFTNYWRAYAAVILEEKHFATGKYNGLTVYV